MIMASCHNEVDDRDLLGLRRTLAFAVSRLSPHGPFAWLDHIRMQDGLWSALKAALSEAFPGRLAAIGPAAVALPED